MTKSATAKKPAARPTPARSRPAPAVDMTMKRTNYYMPNAYKQALVQAAGRIEGCTPTDLVREGVRVVLRKHGIDVPACS